MITLLHFLLLVSLSILVACNNSAFALGDHHSSQDEIDYEPDPENHSFLEDSTPTSQSLYVNTNTPLPVRTLEESILASPTPTPTSKFNLCSPLKLHAIENLPAIISGPYDPPPHGKDERHHGVDFGYWNFEGRTTMQGELVQSVLPGIVTMVLHDRFPYGNTVIVETPYSYFPANLVTLLGFEPDESLYVLYAHLDTPPWVDLGAQVEACQLLGEVGLSGNTDVAHLHLETRLGPPNTIFESMLFYSTSATIKEMDNYRLWRTSGIFRHFDPMLLLLSNLP